jgi:para-aminobenzoate synthetase component I
LSWPSITTQGFPELDPARRRHRARQRLGEFKAWLSAEIAPRPAHSPDRISANQLAPRYAVPGPAGLASNFSREKYLAAVERAIEYIGAGDIFQVNIAQRLLLEAQQDSATLYQQLRRRNPATFAGYFDLGTAQILSASPERFLRVAHSDVEARPIKGTRARIARPEADLFAGDELLQNQKDRAENVMIVDLLRNDLSRVCLPDSVQVTQLCGLETYEFVQHLVSAVCGSLSPGQTAFDLLRASFPGGSITAALTAGRWAISASTARWTRTF